jgi:CheY-like chemotaxis protein
MHPKILLVDDREDNLLSIETILEQDGYRFVKANSGSQALKILLTEYDFAMILMDVKMPNLNGFETATIIYQRERLRHIPIIFITANNFGEENIFKGYSTGAVDYIYKPINPDLLRAKVSVFIDLYKKNHQLIAQEQRLVAINKNLDLSERCRKKR